MPDSTGRFPKRADARVPDLVQGQGGGAFSVATIAGTTGGTCRAVAVITENSAGWSQDLLILILSAIVGLGLTLVVQGVTDAFRTRNDDAPPASGPEAQAPQHTTTSPQEGAGV